MRKKRIGWMFLSISLIFFIEYHGITLADDLEPMAETGTSTVKVCLPPAWSLKLPTSTRFETVLDGGAVLDWETGLVWEQSPDRTTRTWSDAIWYAYRKEVGGRKGWRLPTVEELASLVDPTQSNPSLPSGHPFTNVQSDIYWSSPTDVRNASSGWGVDFRYGIVGTYDKSGYYYIWCVRGGHGHDGQ
jgi:hypothetical protein